MEVSTFSALVQVTGVLAASTDADRSAAAARERMDFIRNDRGLRGRHGW
jgi:hypothetical protein